LTAAAAASAIGTPARIRIITGHFDPVHADHARRLRALRDGSCTVVVLTDSDQPISPQRVRAEVVAGLASVDYVVITDGASVEELIAAFSPAEIIREETADAERTRKLVLHVHARQAAV
jgi:bifunctional ADP-heptose synthase (sugar kinase/adenylyltransferase)